jgi:siroheme synthase-like protein
MTRIFPIALVLEGRPCLVVGGNLDAAQRAEALLQAGAQVSVVTERPDAPHPELEALASAGRVTLERRAFVSADLDDKWLAVLTTPEATSGLTERVARAAEERRVPFCAVDVPASSSFFHVALARAGALVVAVSTAGAAPALGRRLREELERVFRDAGLASFVDHVCELRQKTPSAERRKVLGDAVAGVRFSGRLELPEQ